MLLVSVILGGLLIFKSDEVAGQIKISTEKVSNYSSSKPNSNENQTVRNKGKMGKINANENIKTDTVIVENSTTETTESIVNYGSSDKFIYTTNRKGNFWINKKGEFFINGKKYNFSPELNAKIKPHLAKMSLLTTEMDVYGKTMDEYGKAMDLYGKAMDEKAKPMNEYGKLLDAQGKLLDEQVKLQTKYSLKASLADLENEKVNKESFQKLGKEHELKVEAISKEMERLGKEMEKIGSKMTEASKPMEEQGKKMEIEGKKMEIVGRKLEKITKEIINLLPPDLKKKLKEIELGFEN
jgi:hypothetical protein